MTPPRTIDSFFRVEITQDTYVEFMAAAAYWEARVIEEGGRMMASDDGLPVFDAMERDLATRSAGGDVASWLVLRDEMLSRHGDRVFALLERAAFRGAMRNIKPPAVRL